MKQFTSFNPDVAKYWNQVNDSFTVTKGNQFPDRMLHGLKDDLKPGRMENSNV